jgi:hypothetical protein
VPAPAKFTVVAFVLTKSNDALGVVKDVVIAGLVPNTKLPEPVSSEITPANCADVVAANCDKLPVVSAAASCKFAVKALPSAVLIVKELPEAVNEETAATLTFAAEVILPYVSTVITGTLVDPPYVVAVTPEVLNATLPVVELYVIGPPKAASIDDLALAVVK